MPLQFYLFTMVIYKNGDVLKGEETFIAHGCNCRGSFAYGIAGQIANQFPEAKEAYLKKHQKEGWKLGEVQRVECEGKIIFNCATQDTYGNPKKSGKVYADLEAMRIVFIKLKYVSVKEKITFGIPKIGSDLGGLEWSKIELLLQEIFTNCDIVVYNYEKLRV